MGFKVGDTVYQQAEGDIYEYQITEVLDDEGEIVRIKMIFPRNEDIYGSWHCGNFKLKVKETASGKSIDDLGIEDYRRAIKNIKFG